MRPRLLFPALPLSLLLLASCVTAPRPREARFTILQVNDVYKIEGLEGGSSGGMARLRTLRKQLEADGRAVLLLHGGDALYPSVMSKYLEAKPVVEVMNLLDGDAEAFDPRMIVGFGNHEFDNRDPRILLDRLRDSRFRWVASNALLCPQPERCDRAFSAEAPAVSETFLVDAGGTTVGLFGLLYPMEKSYAKTTDPIAAARSAVASLRSRGARVVVAVTHQDMPEDVRLVRAVPGIDLVVGGHDHLFMQERVNGTWITKADADVKSVVVHDVRVPPAGPVRTEPRRVLVDSKIAKDAEVDAAVQVWLGELARKLGGNETIGMTKNLLEGVEPAVRGRETALGNLLADAAREQMGTDAAVVNGGSIRINDNVPPGPVTKYDMEGIFYFTNRLVAFAATGQQVLDMLRNAVSRVDAGDGRFLQVSGITFRYGRRDGAFVVEPEDVRIGGRPLDLSARYTVATSDFLYTRGIEDGYVLFTDAHRPPKVHADREADFRTVVEQYIRARGTVETAVEGRIVFEH